MKPLRLPLVEMSNRNDRALLVLTVAHNDVINEMTSNTPRNTLLGALLGGSMLSTAVAYDLDQHAWRDRLLIIAAPTQGDPGVQQQRAVIEKKADAIADRKLRVFELFENGGTRDGIALTPAETAQLRTRFGIGDKERIMLLIGYDGGIKRRSSVDTDLRIFFLDIDSMPMRQAEIREKRAAGQPVTKP